MIVVRVDGGLGNQMFQVAFGMQLAKRQRTQLYLDLSSYAHTPVHGYQLDKFRFSAPLLDDQQRQLLPARYRSPQTKASISTYARDLVARACGNTILRRVREKPFGFSEKYLQVGDNSYLVGYWQSLKFFPDCQAEVREAFALRGGLSEPGRRLSDRLSGSHSLALHIRRGDYVTNSQASAIYRHLGLEYYQHCVSQQLARQSGVEVYVFSNDLPWCAQHLQLPCPMHFVTEQWSAGPHEDMWLMTAAESLAMANSTFSWWGAWLSGRANRTVYSPKHWFHPGTLNDRDLPVEGWHLIDDAALPHAELPEPRGKVA